MNKNQDHNLQKPKIKHVLTCTIFKLKTPQQSVSPKAVREEIVLKHNTGIR